MTKGKPIKSLCSFALPLMVANVVQQLYTVTDSMIVGNFMGINPFAAVGATGFLFSLVISVVIGFTQGCAIIFAQRFGSKDEARFNVAVATSIKLSLIFGVILSAICLIFAKPTLLLIGTPPEILADSNTYISVLLGAMLINVMNLLATDLLMAYGDSKTPLFATITSSVVNIVLDLLFVVVFSFGVAGVAISTVIAWTCSLAICVFKLRKTAIAGLKINDFKRDRQTERDILRLSAPMLFRNFVISCGGLIIQGFINSYGVLFVAGTATAQRLFSIMEMIGAAVDGAYATFAGQNFGNQNILRIKLGLFAALKVSMAGVIVICSIFIIFGRFFVSALVTGDPEELSQVLTVAYRSLVVTAACMPFLYLLYIFRSGIQGMGKTLIPTLSGFLELGARLFGVVVLPTFIGEWGIYFSNGLGWIAAAILLIFGFIYHYREAMHEHSKV